jgi:hypothetical protein
MREMKGYRDPYTDIKRTSAFSGPYKAYRIRSAIVAVALGGTLGVMLFLGLAI